MTGRNRALHENRILAKALDDDEPCIFLSHISVDRAAARAIGAYIMAQGGIDVYLDMNDDDLQRAAAAGDAAAITAFIERGLSSSTHILCLVSQNTARSWWVPYELGFGKRSGKPLATLRLKDTELPAYLEISEIIQGTKSLNQYLTAIKSGLRKIAASGRLTESLVPHHTTNHPLDAFLEWQV